MSNNKENNMKLHGIITTFFNDTKAKFGTKQDNLSATQLVVVNANPFLTADKTKLDGIDLSKYYLKTEVDTELDKKALKDLSNVNVGVANAGKFYSVSATGGLELVDAPSGGGGIPDGYEEKEITITPAIYGWKTINQTTYDFSDSDIGKKLQISIPSDLYKVKGVGFVTKGHDTASNTDYYSVKAHINHLKVLLGQRTGQEISLLWDTINKKLTFKSIVSTTTYSDVIDQYTFEIWDIITPAVKATALVKK